MLFATGKMMREIEFRGKQLETGKWLYGSLIKTGNNNFHIWESEKVKENNLQIYYDDPSLVDSATIGQFTGLKDKNGTKIFEGDKIVWSDYSSHQHVNSVRCRGSEFILDFIGLSLAPLGHWNGDTWDPGSLEVIGNIFD